MDKLHAIRVCRAVARQGGFATAGRHLNISTPSVSRLVSELEAHLGVRLFVRSTRQISLTEDGEDFLSRAGALVDDLESLSAGIRERRSVPRGHLTVSSVVAFGQEMIAPVVPGFLARYPEVTLDLRLENRHVDLIGEQIDLALRVGPQGGLAPSGLVARRLFAQRLIFVATPGYISRYGRPAHPDDIARMPAVKQVTGNWGVETRLVRGGKTLSFRMPDTFVVNGPGASLNAVLSGHVLGLVGDFVARDLLASGALERLLPDCATEEQQIYAVFAHRSYMPARLRLFIDYLARELNTRGSSLSDAT